MVTCLSPKQTLGVRFPGLPLLSSPAREAQVGRALLWYSRGCEFDSRPGLGFFSTTSAEEMFSGDLPQRSSTSRTCSGVTMAGPLPSRERRKASEEKVLGMFVSLPMH